MVPCGFNTLTPALIFSANLTSLNVIGPLDIGTTLNYGQGTGFLKSVHGFPVSVDATVLHVDDFATSDPSNFHLNVRGAVQTHDNVNIALTAEGPLKLTPKVLSIFSGDSNATATEWGEGYSGIFWKFYATNGKYQELEDKQFISSVRLFPGSGKYVASLEYRISEVETGPVCKD